MDKPLIEFKNVSKRFGNQVVLDNINISFYRGEVATIIGKSGMGKTVILKHIIGLLEPDSGQILFEGMDLPKLSKKERNKVKSRFGYMFQNVALFDSMDVFENVALPLRETTKMPEKIIREKVLEKLEKLEISDTLHKYPAQLSGGMKKRVGLARALITDPDIVLFDEPTTGLDPIRKNAVFSMISHMQKKLGFTAIIVSHALPDVLYITQKVAMLDQGNIIIDCEPEDLNTTQNSMVKMFVKGIEPAKDNLTGLKTKTQITKQFSGKAGEVTTSGFYSVILFKLHGLEEINEKLGFVAGQKVICHFARFVENYLHISGENSRYSDDSILTVLPNTKIGMCRILLQKVEVALKKYPPLATEGYEKMNYSISAGLAESRQSAQLIEIVGEAREDLHVIGFFEIS